MRIMFSQEQINKIIEMMNYTSSDINSMINAIVGDIDTQGGISDNKLYLFTPIARVKDNKIYIDSPNVNIENNNLIIL